MNTLDISPHPPAPLPQSELVGFGWRQYDWDMWLALGLIAAGLLWRCWAQ